MKTCKQRDGNQKCSDYHFILFEALKSWISATSKSALPKKRRQKV